MSEKIIDICPLQFYTVWEKAERAADAKGERTMPRPKKCRRVCDYPPFPVFLPAESGQETEYGCAEAGTEAVYMTVDEYETIRLIDGEELSQEQCGEQMQISRTAVQLVYASARKKLASALVEGRPLKIGGGSYQLCCGEETCGRRQDCYKYALGQQYQKAKGENVMRIAVTYENGQVFQHFGHTEQFKIYDVENGKVIASEVVDTNGQGHGALAGVLGGLKADTLICGGIGGGAVQALQAAGIRLYAGVTGDADRAVEALLAGEIAPNAEANCDHHGHGEGHECGHHGEGHQGCGGHHGCHN